jgi:hypothetical protein
MAAIPITIGAGTSSAGRCRSPLFISLMLSDALTALWLPRAGPLPCCGSPVARTSGTYEIGLALVGAGAILVFISTGRAGRERLRPAGGYLLLAMVRLSAWLGWLGLSQNGARPRGSSFRTPHALGLYASDQGSMVNALWQALPFAEWLPKLLHRATSAALYRRC